MEKDKKLSQEEAEAAAHGKASAVAEAANADEFVVESDAAEPESAAPTLAEKPENGQAAAYTPPDAAKVQPSPVELQDRFLRLAADFANYKRRTEAERAEIADWAKREMALALLPILDDFGLMMEYDTQHPERLAEGAKLIRQKMMELLSKQGLEKIEALNQPYDYERHEAVLGQPVKEATLDHVVLSVIQEGYMFKGKVLRPSKVIFGQYVAPEKEAEAQRPDQRDEKNREPN